MPSTNYTQQSVTGVLEGDTTTQSATVVNTRRLGDLTLNKYVEGNATASSFTFTGTLTGPSGVLLNNYSISGTGVTLDTYDSANNSYPFTATVVVGTPTVITGIPYGTAYTVTETDMNGAVSKTENNTQGVIDGSSPTATITNHYPKIIDVTVVKTSTDDGDKSGGEIDLYYKEHRTPVQYTINEPSVVPTPVKGYELTGDTEPAVPNVKQLTESTEITTYTYNYNGVSGMPSVNEGDWILPRSDNDYIYFRDYNTGTNKAYGDYNSFANPGNNNSSEAQGAKSSWLRTDLKYNNEGQKLEIDYDHRYWYQATFTSSDDQKPEVKYSIWERFVDRYNGVDTVVWKIQPPDGYDRVRFSLFDGGNCIRNTQQISFQLGDIFHKTDWGGEYKKQYGTDCYYLVPIVKEASWPLYHSGSDDDDRMDWSAQTIMDQAIRYTPTEQKIVFHCNSDTVWHNIHIEFFTDGIASDHDFSETVSSTTKYYKYVGQHFPGYMMEPYAYAGDNYRVGKYLTYELTIPKEAKYFRVNNGIDNSNTKGEFTAAGNSQSPYAYRSTVTALKGAENNGTKNYDNYFSINGNGGVNNIGISVSNASAVTLDTWPSVSRPSADS